MYHVPDLHSIHFLSNTPQIVASLLSNSLKIPIVGRLDQNIQNKFINSRLLEVNKTRLLFSAALDSPTTIENVKQDKELAWKSHSSRLIMENSQYNHNGGSIGQKATLPLESQLFLKQIDNFPYLMRLHDFHIHSITFQIKNKEALKMLYERAQQFNAIGIAFEENCAILKVPFTDVLHILIVDENYYGNQFVNLKGTFNKQDAKSNINYIDHVAIAVEKNSADSVTQWYIDALDFERYMANSDDDIDHGLVIQGLRTLVLCPKLEDESSMSRAFKLVIVEPIEQENGKMSQIQEFLEYNGGSGVAHIAFNTSDICADVDHAQKNGLDFVSVPYTYYKLWKDKEGYDDVPYNWDVLKKLSIMVDGNANGKANINSDSNNDSINDECKFKYLLQTFTHPLGVRPTIYFEFIDRRGSTGFGKGNIGQLFEAIALLQKERGNEYDSYNT